MTDQFESQVQTELAYLEKSSLKPWVYLQYLVKRDWAVY